MKANETVIDSNLYARLCMSESNVTAGERAQYVLGQLKAQNLGSEEQLRAINLVTQLVNEFHSSSKQDLKAALGEVDKLKPSTNPTKRK